jgi:phosphoenolpyruvate synthase/pyruvate phosphate dikinase
VTAGVAVAVRHLTEVTVADAGAVGGKAADLDELVRAGFDVPPGFVLPAAYLEARVRKLRRSQVRPWG